MKYRLYNVKINNTIAFNKYKEKYKYKEKLCNPDTIAEIYSFWEINSKSQELEWLHKTTQAPIDTILMLDKLGIKFNIESYIDYVDTNYLTTFKKALNLYASMQPEVSQHSSLFWREVISIANKMNDPDESIADFKDFSEQN